MKKCYNCKTEITDPVEFVYYNIHRTCPNCPSKTVHTIEDKHLALAEHQFRTVRSIRSMVLFFVVLTVIGMIIAFFLTIGTCS